MGDVAEPLGVLETKGAASTAYGPVLALFAENRLLRPGAALKYGCNNRFNGFTTLALRFHLILPLARVTSHQTTPRRCHSCYRSRSQRSVQGVDQSLIAEGFGQEANSSRLQRLLACISVPCRDEDDGYWTSVSQMTLQLETVHHRHRDVEDQAGHIRELGGVQESAGRVESRGAEPDRLQQALDRLTDIYVVIDDCDESVASVLVAIFHCRSCSLRPKAYPA